MGTQGLWANAKVGASDFITMAPIVGTMIAVMAIGVRTLLSLGSTDPGHQELWSSFVGFVLFGLVYWQYIGSFERRKWGRWLTGSRSVLGAVGDVLFVLSGGEMRAVAASSVGEVRIVSESIHGVRIGFLLKRGLLDAQGFEYHVVRCQQEAGVDVLCDWTASKHEVKRVLEAVGLAF